MHRLQRQINQPESQESHQDARDPANKVPEREDLPMNLDLSAPRNSWLFYTK
jgi:hypothetical protein